MITPEKLYSVFCDNKIEFYAGVPDSLLKDFNCYLMDRHPENKHIIAVNEGCAVGLAAGYYLATNTISVVYMQNSGIGNAINPLVSLDDPKVYGIPVLLMIGWRGETGSDGLQIEDEPQHTKQGLITPALLDVLGIEYRVISADTVKIEEIVSELIGIARVKSAPVALIVRKGTFSKYEPREKQYTAPLVTMLKREEAIIVLAENLPENALIVSTTGKASRELFEYRVRSGSGHSRDFLTVGSMGHASQIAAGIAIAEKTRPVFCFDGDGAVLMHMGGLSTSSEVMNLHHIILNNGSHESVGGQPTRGFQVDFCAIARAVGYAKTMRAKNRDEILQALVEMSEPRGKAAFLEIPVRLRARQDLGRPTITPSEIKTMFMKNFIAKK